MIKSYKNLFLRQSYLDSYDEYIKSLENDTMQKWHYVILTASNEAQAEAYMEQIEYRKTCGKLPKGTEYIVLPDPDGQRVGSGGATLNALKHIADIRKNSCFSGIRILVIHTGGDSKRVPQYSACGKIFSPVPRMLPDGRRSTLFDEFIIVMSGVPARITEGMLVCSGDVLLLFNPLQIDFYSEGAAALSIKEDVETGKNHGVFLGDDTGNVKKFLHKQSVGTLNAEGAVDSSNKVNIDTGAVIFGCSMLDDIYTLIDTETKFRSLVNDRVRLSFYADFLYPLASESLLEDFYKETPEGDYSDELSEARTILWEKLRKYRMKLIRFSPASFIHFGTTRELLRLVTDDIELYKFLDWSGHVNTNIDNTGDGYAVSNSYISDQALIGKGSYIEDSYIHDGATVGNQSIISGITLRNISVPDNVVLHGLKLKNGKFTARIYGIDDNPKENMWFGKDIGQSLWTAPLFPVCDTITEAVEKTVNNIPADTYISLKDSFNDADVSAILPWQNKLDDRIKAEFLLGAIDNRKSADATAMSFERSISQRVKEYLLTEADKLSVEDINQFSKKIRIYYYLSKLIDREKMSELCFGTICEAILNTAVKGISYNPEFRITKKETTIRLPVRVNWGGGWTDTPPYCMERGGTVLNAAIVLDGNLPVEVIVKKSEIGQIILASADNGSYREFTDIRDLQECRSPSDPFALHKAALIACGVIPYTGNISLRDITQKLGGGLYLSTQVINIPRGSGLGTSSILAGACIKGIYDLLGTDITDNDLYNRVLCMEQLMSTGGGWQDQVGGLAKGIKIITAERGLKQKIICTPVNISEDTLNELSERFAIIYTGQRRLARNLLREVVGKYIGNEPNTLNALREIQQIAELMRNELEEGNVDKFAALLNKHWEESKKLDAGCTNTCIDHIFIAIDDLIDGRMICGAGGGGFLQVILKKDVSADLLKARLNEVFADSGVGVWKCKFRY